MMRSDAQEFVASLMPAALVAMGATEVASLLEGRPPTTLGAAQRHAIVDSYVKMHSAPGLSTQALDELRRTGRRLTETSSANHAVWTSMAYTRAAMSLGAWQMAVELAVVKSGQMMCGKDPGGLCGGLTYGFAKTWQHYIGHLRRLNPEAANLVGSAYAGAAAAVSLRNRLLHGQIEEEDRALVKEQSPRRIVEPLVGLRERVIEATLTTVFCDTNPTATIGEVVLETVGIPTTVLPELLGSET